MKIEEISLEEFKCGIINSIQTKYKNLRQSSKTITFAAQYQGTYKTFMNSGGFTEIEAKEIEFNYHNLYIQSKQWLDNLISSASNCGYITGAFGLRVRTPILKQTLWNDKSAPYESKSEARTAGNAAQQSYGLLNNRAAIELQQRVLNSKYKNDIRPMVHIHDSQYFLIRNTYGCVEWFNKNLIECMCWNELPEIQHPIVKIQAEMDINYPNWSYSIKVPINATKQQLKKLIYER